MQKLIQATATHADYPRLPARYQRGDVIRIVTTIAPRIGLRAGALRGLLAMIHMTRVSDWTSGTAEPVCYREQIKVAAASGVTTRTTRSHEAALVRLGLATKTVGADGSRGRFAQGTVVHGISFRPLIERFHEFLSIAQEVEDETRQTEIFRRKCSAARRSFTSALSQLLETDPKNPALLALLGIRAELPQRYEGLGLADLEQLYETVDNATRSALTLLSSSVESSDTPEIYCRPHIQATTDTHIESCSGTPADMMTARKRAEDNLKATTPKGAVECLEYKCDGGSVASKPKVSETFSPRNLYWMASDDMRMYLDANRRNGSSLTQHDFIQAAITILPAIGVHPSAWDEAVEAMGDHFAAALSVLVVDANRNHPLTPIHSPGAALRTFARLAVNGRLNLHGSLMGLKQRMEMQRSESAIS